MKTGIDLRKVIGLHEDKEIVIKAKYELGLTNYYREITNDEEFLRTERCGKHMLAAIAFRENAKSTFDKTQSTFLPSIGNYYSYFHLSIAMLSLDYATPINQLEKLKHTKLLNLVQSNLQEQGLINTSFLKTMIWLKDIREISNYSLDPKVYDPTGFLQHELYDNKGMYNLMENSFKEAINFIHFATKKVKKYREYFGNRIESFITDSQGDDILNVFFSKQDEILIENYLKDKFYIGL